MKSPFIGVDPYLEGTGLWPDFHARFINFWCEALLDALPDSYDARIGERVNLVNLTEDRTKQIGPDVAVITREPTSLVRTSTANTATLEPVTLPHTIEAEFREGYIEILHREDQTLVAVLELLSPSNKVEPGLSLYLDKRNHVLIQNVHLFALDLLLGGQRLPHGKPLPPGDFYAIVSRVEQRFDCQVYTWTLRDQLPQLPIPLLAPDADVTLDYAEIFATTYERGRYSRSIDYRRALSSRVSPESRTWIEHQTNGKSG